MKTIELLKTFEDACAVEGLNPKEVLPDFKNCKLPAEEIKALEAHAKLIIVVSAANRIDNDGEKWNPDWTDGNWKYEPWFVMDEGSSGFRFHDCGGWRTGSGVGSRLCFKSENVGEYIANQFIDLYRDYFMK